MEIPVGPGASPGPRPEPGHGLPDDVADRLAPTYLAALAGVAAAEDDQALAARTGVDPAAVDGLVRLALAKLLDAQAEARASRPGAVLPRPPTLPGPVPEPVVLEPAERGPADLDPADLEVS
jgi:hypothetical protein